MDTSSKKELSPSPLSRKQPSNSTLSTGVRKPGLMNPPVKRRGENLESSRLKSPSTQSGEFNLNNSEISNSSFNESPSTYPMPRLSTNLTAQARSSAVGSPTKTLDEEPHSDDSDLMEAQVPLPSTEGPAWLRKAKDDVFEHILEVFRILTEVAHRTGR
jgi:hypothetical protein